MGFFLLLFALPIHLLLCTRLYSLSATCVSWQRALYHTRVRTGGHEISDRREGKLTIIDVGRYWVRERLAQFNAKSGTASSSTRSGQSSER